VARKSRTKSPSPNKNALVKEEKLAQVVPTKPVRIFVGRITRNVTREHLSEIFATFGAIKYVDLPMEKLGQQEFNKGYSYIEYETVSAYIPYTCNITLSTYTLYTLYMLVLIYLIHGIHLIHGIYLIHVIYPIHGIYLIHGIYPIHVSAYMA
jgi:hypothetical protein